MNVQQRTRIQQIANTALGAVNRLNKISPTYLGELFIVEDKPREPLNAEESFELETSVKYLEDAIDAINAILDQNA